jgi:plasmid stability protein
MIALTIKGIPKETHRKLKKRAAANRRSLNNEIIFTLESICGVRNTTTQVSHFQEPVKKLARRK